MKNLTKKLLLIFTALFISLVSQAQTVGWLNIFDCSQSTEGGVNAIDASGNIYTTGNFIGTGIYGAFTFTSISNSFDVFITKTGPTGNVIWAKQAGGAQNDYPPTDIYSDGSGIYFCGTFSSSATFGSTTLTTTIGSSAGYICKMDPSGNFLWAKRYDVKYIEAICPDASGNILATGNFTGSATFGTVTASTTGVDIFAAKLDANGNVIWFDQMHGTDNDDIGLSIVSETSGNIYVSGYFSGTVNFSSYTLTSGGTVDGFILKLNPSGALQWVKPFGGNNVTEVNSLAINSAGNIYFAADYYSLPATFGTFTLTSGSNCVGQIDGAGTVLWTNQFGALTASDYVTINSISADPLGNIYGAGNFSGMSSFGSTTLTSQSMDVFISKINSTGNFVWVKQFGGAAYDFGYKLSQGAGQVYSSGVFELTASIDNFTVASQGGVGCYLLKLSANPIGIKENYQNLNFNIYPNPAKDKLVIESEEFNQTISLSIVDLLGREMLNKNFINSKTESIDVSMLLPGVYFLRLSSNEKSIVVKIVKE